MEKGIIVFLLLALASCSESDDKDIAPQIDVAQLVTVLEHERVEIPAIITDDGVIESIAWEQVEGITVALDTIDSGTLTFYAPEVEVDETLNFYLTAIDDGGNETKVQIVISVINVNKKPTVEMHNEKINMFNGVTSEISVVFNTKEITYTIPDNSNVNLIFSDSDGYFESIYWEEIGTDNFHIDDPASFSAKFTPNVKEIDYVTKLKVTAFDNNGEMASMELTVNVVTGSGISKLDINGNEISESENGVEYHCLKDRLTGKVWERKLYYIGNQDSYRSANNAFTWYNSSSSDKGFIGGDSTCKTIKPCNTSEYRAYYNTQNICGFDNWNLPSVDDFYTLINSQSPEIQNFIRSQSGLSTRAAWEEIWTREESHDGNRAFALSTPRTVNITGNYFYSYTKDWPKVVMLVADEQ